MRLPREQYLALKKYKKKIKEEREGKTIRDRNGHLYMVDSDGSIRRLTGNDLRDRLTDEYGRDRDRGPAFESSIGKR